MMHKQRISAIVVAGGKGKRMGGKTPKQFMKIEGIPILVYSLLAFENSQAVDNIILVLPEKWRNRGETLLKKYHIKKVDSIANAGRTRQASVYNGLIVLRKQNPDFVIIHDAVRPFITPRMIDVCCRDVKKYKAISTAIPLTDAVFDKRKSTIIDRKNLFRLQTPQAFKFHLIFAAHTLARERKKRAFPDDSSILLYYGTKTILLQGEKTNIKVTDREDLRLARKIAKNFR